MFRVQLLPEQITSPELGKSFALVLRTRYFRPSVARVLGFKLVRHETVVPLRIVELHGSLRHSVFLA